MSAPVLVLMRESDLRLTATALREYSRTVKPEWAADAQFLATLLEGHLAALQLGGVDREVKRG